MKTKTKLIEITEVKELPEASTYLYMGIVVPCPDCKICLIASLGYECKFMKI